MSSLCNASDFPRHFNNYLAAYALADPWQRSDGLRTFVGMLGKLGYFRVGRASATSKNTPMVEVQGFFSLARTLPDLVQVDLETLWSQASSETMHAHHAFEKGSSGFDGHFLCVKDGTLTTYRLQVQGT